MADALPRLSVFRVGHASTVFRHSPGGWVAKLFMAFPFMACCSVSHELLGKIPDCYYEPLKPMRLHLLWPNVHITSLVLDHMEISLLNLASLLGWNANGFCSSSPSIMLYVGSGSQLQQIIWAEPSVLGTASLPSPMPMKNNQCETEDCVSGRDQHSLRSGVNRASCWR